MKLGKMSQEFAKDWIKLVNSLKGFKYNAHVNYVSKKTGQVTKFDYVTLDKIYDEAKKDENFAITEPLGTDESGESALQVLVIHKTGETLVSDYYKLRVPENSTKQDEGSAITYTKRYALGSFLGISTDQDNDANPDGEGMKVTKTIGKKISEAQLKILKNLNETNTQRVLAKYEVEKLEDLTMQQASEVIQKLKEMKKEPMGMIDGETYEDTLR